MKAILTFGVLLFSNALFSQSIFLEGRGASGQGLWSENIAGASILTHTSFGITAKNSFGLSELSRAQFKIAKPTKFGVVLVHWEGFGDQLYSQSDWGISLAKALSPHFSMGMTTRYKVEQIAYDKRKALLLDIGIQYVISSKLSAATFLTNPFRDSLESSSIHLGLQYRVSSELRLALSVLKKETLPIALMATATYFPIEKLGLFTAISTQASNNTFGIVYIWKSIAIDTYLSYHHYLGFSPQLALTYSFE